MAVRINRSSTGASPSSSSRSVPESPRGVQSSSSQDRARPTVTNLGSASIRDSVTSLGGASPTRTRTSVIERGNNVITTTRLPGSEDLSPKRVDITRRPQEPSRPPQVDPVAPPPPLSCPDPNTLILLSDGTQKRAGDLRVGDVVRTQHEDTLEWGEHKVTYVQIKDSEKLILTFNHTEFVCSTTHKFYVEGKGWTEVNQMEIGDFVIGLDQSHELLEVKEGTYGEVVVIQIEEAHTYISEGLLSHNKLIFPPGTFDPQPAAEPGFTPIPPSSPGGFFIPGTPTTVTTTTTGTTTRTGTATRINTTSTTRSLGQNRLVGLDVLPYMRSRNVEFIAKKLKPNTLVYPFFDKQNFYDYVVPKILEIEMISGTFVTGETVSGTFIQTELVNINSGSTETSIQFRLAVYNHKYGPYNNPTDIFSSSPYNITEQLQPYSPTSTTLNVDTTSLSDLSLGTYGGNVFIGMTLVGRDSGATARIRERRLVSDNVGTVIGSFFIPNPNGAGNPRFTTGNKTFRLTDNPTNGTIAGTLYTYANANFFADGLITQAQETVLSIRTVETQTAIINETVPITNTTVTVVPGVPTFVPSFPPPPPGPTPPPPPPPTGGGDPGPGPVVDPRPPVTTDPPPPQPPRPPAAEPQAFRLFIGGSNSPDFSGLGEGLTLPTFITFFDSNGDGVFQANEIQVVTNILGPEPRGFQSILPPGARARNISLGSPGDSTEEIINTKFRNIASQAGRQVARENFIVLPQTEEVRQLALDALNQALRNQGLRTNRSVQDRGEALQELQRNPVGFAPEERPGVGESAIFADTPFGSPSTRTLGPTRVSPSLPGRSPASQPPAVVPPTAPTPSSDRFRRPGTTVPTVVATTPSIATTNPPRVPSAPTPAVQPVALPIQQPQRRALVSAPAPSPINPTAANLLNAPQQSSSASRLSSGPNLARVRAGYTGTDPLAQTFKIGSDEDQIGRYATSIDVFFYSKAPELPVYVELRSVELGIPTQKIYPFSKVEILPKDINISQDGRLATRVKFQAPVYLEGNKEHALVLLSDSSDYSVFVSRLGEVDITTALLPESQQRLVTTQPTLGSLFKSQNASTWTPSQYEDLKFNLYAAVFEPTGTVSFFNPELNRSNDQIAILRNNALDIESRRVRVGLGTTLSSSTITDLTAGSFVRQRNTNAIGDFAYVTGVATGTLSIPNSGIGYTPSTGTLSYSGVPLTSVSGFGRGATANITVTNGAITSAGISSGGSGYQIGEILTADAIGITSIGRNLRLSVQQLSAFNELVVDNVQGEFEVGVAKSIQYFSVVPGIGYTDLNGGLVFANEVVTERDGLYINVKHRNHGMHAITNVVRISNAISDIDPVKLTNDVERDFTGNLVVTGLTTAFNTFENVGISSTNPGYIIVNSEIISYTGLNGNVFTGITRGVDSTLQIRHPANSFVFKYELAGVSLRRINTAHALQDVTDSTKENTLDSYYIKIDPSANGTNRSTGLSFPKLYLNSTKSTGGPIIEATQNIPYDIAQPIVQTFTPPQTTITASMRTISGTSIDGSEESFLDRGTRAIKLNQDNFFENPRIIASRVNERQFLNNIIAGNKSLQMTLNLSTINQYLSPVVDLDRVGMILVSNRVNEPVTDYVGDERVSLLETDPNAFVYASKPIELEVPATSIKIILSAHLNIFNDVRAMFAIMKDANETPVYYPFPGNGNVSGDGRTLNISNNNGRPDLPLAVTSQLGFLSEELTFTDYEFTINNLESFKYFSVKLIGSSTSQTYPPRFRDLRIIALA